MEGWSFCCPSNWPIRFPFLFLFMSCAAKEVILGRARLPVLLAGSFAGLSLFWQTDVGLYLLLAGTGYYTMLLLRQRHGLDRLAWFAVSAIGTFVSLALLAFGPRILSPLFFWRLIEPLLVYNRGFGFWLKHWESGWPYLYNLIAPAVALGTIGLSIKQFCTPDVQKQVQARFLFLCAVIGMLLLFKWVNRSIDAVWSINATGALVVLFWWGRYAVLTLGQMVETRLGFMPHTWPLRPRTLIGGAAFLAFLTLGLYTNRYHDPARGITSPLVRIARFTFETPTLAHRLIQSPCTLPCYRPLPIDPSDVELIRANTTSTECVPVLSELDWAYLAEAQRAPGFSWVPIHLTYTHHLLERVEQDLRQANCLFVQRDMLQGLETEHLSLYNRVLPVLREQFVLVRSGKALDMYQRKLDSLPTVGQTGKFPAPMQKQERSAAGFQDDS
jgi:hypothetical protein